MTNPFDERPDDQDQAGHLRRMAAGRMASVLDDIPTTSTPRGAAAAANPFYGPRTARTIAVTGGKGGVGKTNLSVALAVQAARSGMRVVLLDADFGLAKIHILLNLTPRADLRDVLSGNATLEETLVEGPDGIYLLPGASGLADLANLDVTQRTVLLTQLDAISKRFDLLILDTGAGISENVLAFVTSADDAIVVTTPEPTALADAYALIKVAADRRGDLPFHLLINSSTSIHEADQAARRITDVAERFLHVNVNYAGSLPMDATIPSAVRARRPFLTYAPNSGVSSQFRAIADTLLARPTSPGSPAIAPVGNPYAQEFETRPPTFAQRLAGLFGINRRRTS